MALCRMIGTKVALLDDSWLGRDRHVGRAQRWARSVVYNRFGDAFVGTSRQTLAMFRHYNPDIGTSSAFSATWSRTTTTSRQRLAGRTQPSAGST